MIKKVKWDNHPVLKNLELDFTKENGGIYNTIVLAGENGAGKTTVLETLSTFLNLGSFEQFDYIQYEVGLVSFKLTKKDNSSARQGFHIRIRESDGSSHQVSSNRNFNQDKIENDTEDIRHYGCAYSKARSGFKTKVVKSSTTQQIDDSKYEDDSVDDFTSIKQLLVDVSTQDNAEWMELCKQGRANHYDEYKENFKITRFEHAFNEFFGRIKFKGIHSDKDEIRIIFEKNHSNIPVDDLSTGEKQIVFRGAYLLKNINNMSGGVVLIDEPELSMHPSWQQKILKYYRNLFTVAGEQKTQMFFATHSEYVLQQALEDKDNVLIIALTDDNGTIKAKNISAPIVLPTITSAEINYLAFGIVSTDFHIALYGYLQSKYGLNSIKECDEYIKQQVCYDSVLHNREFKDRAGLCIETLPTYIRNAIDHPDSHRPYTQKELRQSIELLINLLQTN
ncbi:MAG: ATP-binding protein [Prevotella sp.]|nr:ATP-binding protein [Prevotella sp.]